MLTVLLHPNDNEGRRVTRSIQVWLTTPHSAQDTSVVSKPWESALSTSLMKEVPLYFMVDISSSAFTGVFVIISLTICNSKIPQYMLEIKATIGSLIDKHKFGKLMDRKEIAVFERMEKKDIIYMSACGMVNFRRSFLLTSFGTLFSYGLLLVNLK
ncbi:uncharacterized protein TNCV_4732971 [Trichonephila clavipes]|nr:uncharacterized protein TNCV_4732971 [Trichonephila clavipes]